MHTTPQKWLFQTPSEILVHRGVCTLNGMALSTLRVAACGHEYFRLFDHNTCLHCF